LDPVIWKAFTQAADELAELAASFGHRHRRRHAEVDEQVGAMRRARDTPGKAAADRADVDDAALAAVRRALLPLWGELEHRVEHVPHAHDRRLLALALAERRVDERPAGRDAHPERAVVAEDDLLLGRLAEH